MLVIKKARPIQYGIILLSAMIGKVGRGIALAVQCNDWFNTKYPLV